MAEFHQACRRWILGTALGSMSWACCRAAARPELVSAYVFREEDRQDPVAFGRGAIEGRGGPRNPPTMPAP